METDQRPIPKILLYLSKQPYTCNFFSIQCEAFIYKESTFLTIEPFIQANQQLVHQIGRFQGYTFNKSPQKYCSVEDLFSLVPLFFNLDVMSVDRFIYMIQDCSYQSQLALLQIQYKKTDKKDITRNNQFYTEIIRVQTRNKKIRLGLQSLERARNTYKEQQ